MEEENAKRPRPRRRLRTGLFRLGIGFGVFALVALFVVAVLVFAVDRGWQRDRLVAIGSSLAEESLGLEVTVGETTGRFSRGIVLRDVRIGKPQAPLLEFGELAVRWNLRSLFSSEEQIVDSIRLEDWTLSLHRTSQGEWLVIDDLIARFAETEELDAPDSEPRPPLLLRQVNLGPGRLIVRIDSKQADTAARSAILQAQGEIRDLQLDPEHPPTMRHADIQAKLLESDSGIPEFDRAVAATAQLEAAGRRIESFSASLVAPGLRADLHAMGRLDDLESLVVAVHAEDVSPLSGWVQADSTWSGRLVANAKLSGPPDALIGTLHAVARGLVIEGVRAAELDVDLDLREPLNQVLSDPLAMNAGLRLNARGFDPGAFGFEWLPAGEADVAIEGELARGELDLQQGHLELAGLDAYATGRLTRKHIETLDLRLSVANVAPWVRAQQPELDIAGPLVGSAELEGPIEWPLGRIVLHSDGLSFRDRQIDVVDLRFERTAKKPGHLEALIGSPAEPRLRLTADIDVAGERVDFEATALAEGLLALVDEAPELEGRFDASGFVARGKNGPLFDLALHSDRAVFEAQTLGRIDVAASSSDGERIEISKLESEGEVGTVALRRTATVHLTPDGKWNLDAAELEVVLTQSPADPGSILVEARGALPESGALLASGVRPAGGARPARGAGLAGGTETLVHSIEVRLVDVPMANANRFLPDQPELGGELSGRASWQLLREPGWTRGDLVWDDPTIGGVEFDRVETRWTGRPEAIDLELDTILAVRSPLEVRGELRLPAADVSLAEALSVDRLALEANLDDLDIAFLNSLSLGWIRRVAGRVSGSLRIDPSDSGPMLSGRATITAGAFTVPILRQRFAPIEGRIRLENRDLFIEPLRIGRDEANATLDGKIHLAAGSPEIDGQIRFERFPIARSRAASMDVLGKIDFSGTLERPVVRGALSVDDAKIGVPAEDDPIMKEIRIARRNSNRALTEDEDVGPNPLENADVDVTFSVPDSTRVRGQGANLFIAGDARVTQKPSAPLRIMGEARVVNGTYTFQGRLFRVRRGRVLLTGDQRLDPILDVEARLPVDDIVAIIELSGRMSAPIIRLTSEPPRSDQDVLAYLLFGRPADQVTGAGNTRFDAAAARLVAGVAESELREVLGDSMPVDSIEIGADAEGNTSEIGFGKYLSQNLFFRYVHILGDEPADRIGVEYRLNDAFSVGSRVSSTGDAGLDLIFRRDF
jgi:autotransporter translocation and assembly factor TamB